MRGLANSKAALSLSVHLMLAHTRDPYRKKILEYIAMVWGVRSKVDLHTTAVCAYVVTCFGLFAHPGYGAAAQGVPVGGVHCSPVDPPHPKIIRVLHSLKLRVRPNAPVHTVYHTLPAGDIAHPKTISET